MTSVLEQAESDAPVEEIEESRAPILNIFDILAQTLFEDEK